jgi:hypothetical protein
LMPICNPDHGLTLRHLRAENSHPCEDINMRMSSSVEHLRHHSLEYASTPQLKSLQTQL